MRAGEILALIWTDIDLEQGIIILRDTQNGRSRYAYMTAEVRAMLVKLPNGNSSNFVFTRPDGAQYNYNIFSTIVRGVVTELGSNTRSTDSR